MSSSDRLAVLAAAERNQLESLLMEFDQAWGPLLLRDYCGRLESEPRELFRRLAAAELVKIDLQRRWSSGQGKLLEEYIAQIPAVGTVESVDAELILVEFTARRSVDASLVLESYASRFPKQYERLAQMAAQLRDSQATSSDPKARAVQKPGQKPAQASIETSRVAEARDTKAKENKANQKAQADDLPVEFGRYRILRALGSGAMGAVYLAHDSQLDRQVAIKTPSFKGHRDEELVARFYREARAAAKIHHRNICPVYDVGEIDGRHFISMAFVKGRSMSEFITPNKLPPPKTSAILVHRLATALAEAHRHKVIHRDLKPANIMIDMKREPVVMDFGLARQTDTESRMTQSGMVLGTPAYMSPEQLSGNPSDVGPAADIYALGVILYELLTGKLPFRGAIAQVVYKIMHEEPTAPSEIRPEVDPELERICAKMMAKSRDERFSSMDEVATALKSYLTQGQQKASRQPSTKQPGSGGKDSRVATGSTVTKTDSDGVSETGALNAFFAAKEARSPTQTSVESAPSRKSDPLALKTLPKTSSGRLGGKSTWIAAGLAGVVILVLGIFFLVRTPHGTIRIETVGDLDGLEVLIDGNAISLTATEKVPAREHELALKLGGAELKLDPKTNQFIVTRSGAESRLSVSIGDVRLSSRKFTVTRKSETVLKIELRASSPELAAANPRTGTGSGHDARTVARKKSNHRPMWNADRRPATSPPIGTAWSKAEPFDFGAAHPENLLRMAYHRGDTPNRDLWMRTRASTSEPWSLESELTSLNSDGDDASPCLSADGLTIVFESDRPGGHGATDLWMSTRVSIDASWSKPSNLGTEVNSTAADGLSALAADGRTLIFASGRRGSDGPSDLWMTERAAAGQSWSPATRLSQVINSPGRELAPLLSSDGLQLFFTSDRPGGCGSADIWVSRRESLAAAWSAPENLGPNVNGRGFDYGNILSPDGRLLLFTSNGRDGREAGLLWGTRVLDLPNKAVPETPITPKPFSGALAGATWSVTDSDDEQYTFFFQPGGVLHYDAGRGRRTNGTWRRDGDKITITTNGGYSNIDGSINEEGMSGKGISRSGHVWTWQARLQPAP